MTTYFLYHAKCQDGLGARYAAYKKFGDAARYIAVSYNKPLPNVAFGKDDEVYIADFSYSREILLDLREKVKTLVVLDHHQTAEKALKGLDFAHFDMNKSGAVLAWEYFHPGTPVPKILTRIEDRDIWRWQYRDTAPVLASVSLAEGNFNIWDQLEANFEAAVERGKTIVEYQDNYVKRRSGPNGDWFYVNYCGFDCLAYCSTHMISEIGNKILENQTDPKHSYGFDVKTTFTIGFSFEKTGTPLLSFRSLKEGGPDISVLASALGGGGHKNASGAAVDMDFLKLITELNEVTEEDVKEFSARRESREEVNRLIHSVFSKEA